MSEKDRGSDAGIDLPTVRGQINGWATQLSAEIVALVPALGSISTFLRRNRGDVIAGGVLFVLFHQLYFWTGKQYQMAGVLYPSDVLFGWDVPRVVGDMVTGGHNIRSNVHPLFVLFAKPFGYFYTHFIGMTAHVAAVAVVAQMQATANVLVLVFFRTWGVRRAESLLFAAIFGSSCIGYFSGVVPETGVFAINALTFCYILAVLALRHGRKYELAWLLSGVFTYGITISNASKNIAAYGFSELTRRKFVPSLYRTIFYGVMVIFAGAFLTRWIGSSFHLMADEWIATPEDRGGDLDRLPLQLVMNFVFYDLVGATPSLDWVTWLAPGTKEVILDNQKVVSFNDGFYKPAQAVLAVLWGGILLGSIVVLTIRRRSDELRLAAIFGFGLIWDFLLFAHYYVPFEGLLHWSAHVIPHLFLLTVFLADASSRARRGIRFAFLGFLAVFLVGELANNIWVLQECLRLLVEEVPV